MKKHFTFWEFRYLLVCFLLFSSCDKTEQNSPPVAKFTLHPFGGNTEVIFTFNAAGSFDVEDSLNLLRFRWDWEDDGVWDTDWSEDTIAQHRFWNSKVYQINLQVKDSDGATSLHFEFLEVDEFVLLDPRDRQEYKTIQIGDQLWIAENLNYETAFGSYCFNDSAENCNTYGHLYSFEAAQNACPPGWKLPDSYDWNKLINYVGENPGDKLRSTTGWNSGHNGLDTYGFNVIPTGFRRDYGAFTSTDSYSYYWSSDSYDLELAWSWLFVYNRSTIDQNFLLKGNGFSVRCLRF